MTDDTLSKQKKVDEHIDAIENLLKPTSASEEVVEEEVSSLFDEIIDIGWKNLSAESVKRLEILNDKFKYPVLDTVVHYCLTGSH
jgi:hypothetical protein